MHHAPTLWEFVAIVLGAVVIVVLGGLLGGWIAVALSKRARLRAYRAGRAAEAQTLKLHGASTSYLLEGFYKRYER